MNNQTTWVDYLERVPIFVQKETIALIIHPVGVKKPNFYLHPVKDKGYLNIVLFFLFVGL